MRCACCCWTEPHINTALGLKCVEISLVFNLLLALLLVGHLGSNPLGSESCNVKHLHGFDALDDIIASLQAGLKLELYMLIDTSECSLGLARSLRSKFHLSCCPSWSSCWGLSLWTWTCGTFFCCLCLCWVHGKIFEGVPWWHYLVG